MNKEIPKYVGEKIKFFRTNNNITQQELAEYLKTTSQTVSRYENGILEANQDVLFALADYFKVPIDSFFPERDIKNNIFLNQTEVLFDKSKDILSDDDRATIEFIMKKTIDNYEKNKNN